MHIMSKLLNKQYITDETLKTIQQVSRDIDLLSGGTKKKKKKSNSNVSPKKDDKQNSSSDTEDEDENNIIKSSETEQNNNQENQEDEQDFDFNIEELTKEMEEDFQQEQQQQEQNYDDKQNEKDIDKLDKVLDTDTTKDINKGMIKFDSKYDDTIYEYSPRPTYNKYYVFSQYIYKDDTIKAIKEKICCTILNKEKYGKNNVYNYIVPSRQYLWFYDKSNTAIPLGFMWKSLYTTLNYKYEPQQNIKLYENLEGFIKKFYNEFIVYAGALQVKGFQGKTVPAEQVDPV